MKIPRHTVILTLTTILVVSVYLLASVVTYRIGFPLDDAWIHQTYARNLAVRQEWAFLPDQPSAGSTSPLWTLLLAGGFFLPGPPYFWTYLLGAVLLVGLGHLVEAIIRAQVPSYSATSPWIGVFCILEWRLSWLALSGMETLLHIFLVTLVLGMLVMGSRKYFLLGSLIGLSIWVRPDGVTLLVPVAIYILLVEKTAALQLRALLVCSLGSALLMIPYLWFNFALSGLLMPNTFYAKQQEYAIWQAVPLAQRLSSGVVVFVAGPSLVLLWGFVQKVLAEIRMRRWVFALIAAWVVGYIVLYISRLPAYQHGRYLMPALGIFIVVGLIGILESLAAAQSRWQQFHRRLVLTMLVALTLVFTGFGAFTYGQNVAFIENEMVDTAKWVARNLPPTALVAAHDIGALGYFGERRILDLAGLISPEVIPFIRDEARLSEYISQQGADYLVVFPKWYQTLSTGKLVVYAGQGNFSDDSSLGNMSVYEWKIP